MTPNAINVLCHIIAKLKDEQGVIQVPGYYDSVRPLTEQERAQWGSLPFSEEEMREHEMGAKELTGEPGYSALERIWARTTLDANGISYDVYDVDANGRGSQDCHSCRGEVQGQHEACARPGPGCNQPCVQGTRPEHLPSLRDGGSERDS